MPGIAVASVVVHDGEIARALLDQCVGQLVGQAGSTEAANHHRGAIRHIFQRFYRGGWTLFSPATVPNAVRALATAAHP